MPRSEPFTFDLSGGRLCLDFANTVSQRGGDAPLDHVRSYADLVLFAVQTGIVNATSGLELGYIAAAYPTAARDALARAIALREALFRLFAAISAGRPPRPSDLRVLNEHVPSAFERARLVKSRRQFTLKTDVNWRDLGAPIVPIVRSGVDLLTSSELDRVRGCAARTCEWLFIDTTKNRTRRWCDMAVCGNREKVRRFRERSARRP
jgi:predicted RNA-binding Zn ribbon-like protein